MTKIGRNDPCPCNSGMKYKKCCGLSSTVAAPPRSSSTSHSTKLPFEPDREIEAEKLKAASIRSERCVISVEIDSTRYKLMQVIFLKDGSLCVNFPYYKNADGLVSLVTLPANLTYPADPELNPGGKVTTNLVKYSHHPDGRTHFSQTGQVATLVRKQSVPLADAQGHIFTIKLQGLGEFEIENSRVTSKEPASKRMAVNIKIQNIIPDAFKFVGQWYSKDSLVGKVKLNSNGHLFLGVSEDGKDASYAILLANPFLINNEEYFLFLSVLPTPSFDRGRGSSLTFIGGFDQPDIMNDLSKETSFLALTYPIKNIDELAKEIGSIDLRAKIK